MIGALVRGFSDEAASCYGIVFDYCQMYNSRRGMVDNIGTVLG